VSPVQPGRWAIPDSPRTTVLQLERAGNPSVFGPEVRAAAAEIIARYPAGQHRSALLPMLHLVQSEQGHVSPDGIAFCAEILGITKAQVDAVATFYTMYKRNPVGQHLVSVCTNTLCGLMGGDDIYAALTEKLGVSMNETTADGMITVEHAECLAACDYAPVVTVNYEFYDNQSVESATELVDALRAGEFPHPTRGAPLCTFRQIERQIAGFVDERPEALDASAGGVPTEVGVRLAVERRESAPAYPMQATDEASEADAEATATGTAAAGTAGGEQRPSSSHDAPLQTAKSDPANPTPTESSDGAATESAPTED
jgi:NADH-quinone oxidoreductase subunit E